MNCCAAPTAMSSAAPSARRSMRQPHMRKTLSYPMSRTWLMSSISPRSVRRGFNLGVDPLGGAALPYWEAIDAVHKLDIAIANPRIDPIFSFMTADHDGMIRMDPSSRYAMAGLLALKDRYHLS